MQAASGSSSANAVHNGDSSFANNGAAAPSVSVTNGDAAALSDDESSPNLPVKDLSPCDRDIVRLIGQHLKGLGLK